jgi:hypothetical protein
VSIHRWKKRGKLCQENGKGSGAKSSNIRKDFPLLGTLYENLVVYEEIVPDK